MQEKIQSRTIPMDAQNGVLKEYTPSIETTQFGYLSRKVLNILVLSIGDVVSLGIGLAGAGLLRYLLKGGSMIPEWWWALLMAWLVASLAVGLLPSWGLSTVEEFRRTVLVLIGVFAMVSTAVFLGKIGGQISRLTLTTSFVLGMPLLLYFRLLSKRLLIRWERWGLPTVVYGGAETGQLAIQALQQEKGLGFIPVGIFEDVEVHEDDNMIKGVPLLGGIEDRTSSAPVAVLAMPDLSRHRVLELLDGPLSTYRHVLIIPDLEEAPSLWVTTRDLGGILGLEVTHNLLNPLARLIKRAFDIFTTVGTAPIWIPLCGLIAVLIWIEDQSNPLFLQERLGRHRQLFKAYKFRTMLPDAEKLLYERLEKDRELKAEWEQNFKLLKDPRITRVGAFLRKSSLDELPQLFNVVRGHMSLVGPRPLPPYHAAQLPERIQAMRSRVNPGITGLWQVSGRSESGTEGMILYDPYYVRNWSIWLDLVILFRTLRAVFQRHGAY